MWFGYFWHLHLNIYWIFFVTLEKLKNGNANIKISSTGLLKLIATGARVEIFRLAKKLNQLQLSSHCPYAIEFNYEGNEQNESTYMKC